jgi:electron transfer flavoprotein beta subunit
VKIIALVKYSMDVAEIKVDATTHALRMSGVPQRFGDLDRGVVEAAVRLKEASEADVEVLCFGPAAALAAVKDLLAMGADRATVIEDPFEGSADAAIALRVIEAALNEREPFDLIICGFASDDGYSHQMGPRLAERLRLPFVSYASEISLANEALIADRSLEEGVQTVSTPLPAILSVAEEAFLPRSVTLLQAMKAQKKPSTLSSIEEIGLQRSTLEASSTYDLSAETGIVVNRRRHVLKGDDLETMANLLIDALVDEQVLVLRGGA